MRVLVASTGGAGHVNPLMPFVETLARRGDDVLVVVPPSAAGAIEALGVPYRIGADPPADELAALWDRFPTVPPKEAAVLVNREIFGRLSTAAMLPTVEDACNEWRPDLVLREPAEYASTIVADRRGIDHAQVAISLADVEAASLALAAPALEPYRRGIVDRIRTSPYLTRFPASLDPSPFLVTRRYQEPVDACPEPLKDWWEGADTPLVYISFGSVTGTLPTSVAAYRATLQAVVGLPARVLLTTGHATDRAALGPLPTNVHLAAWVAQDTVLPRAAAVVCHGGSGTTLAALAAGVPLVIIPMFADQPTNARLVTAAGAAVLIEPSAGTGSGDTLGIVGTQHAPRIRAAIETVLTDTSYQHAARRLAAEIRHQPGVAQVLDELPATLAWRDSSSDVVS